MSIGALVLSHAHNAHARTHAHVHLVKSQQMASDPILGINISISKFSKISEREILKEFLLGLLGEKNDVCLRQMRPFFFFFHIAARCRRMISMTPLCGNEWDLIESALCCRNTLG